MSEKDGPRFLVSFRADATAAARARAVAAVGGVIERELLELGVTRVVLPGAANDAFGDLADVAALLANDPAVLSVERDGVVSSSFTPNDPLYFNDPYVGLGQWGIRKSSVDRAWDIARGSPSITVAVIDTGVDPTHPDLAASLVTPATFLTQPSSGCSLQTRDDHSHGTHVAGIIGASGNNGAGIAGVAHGVRILSIKVLDCKGVGLMGDVANAVIHATNAGARIINISLGSFSDSTTLRNAVSYAASRNVLVVASAGNCGGTSTTCPSLNATQYPAAQPEVLAVAATDENDQRASFSTQGSYVAIAGPGRRIVSTTPTYATTVSNAGGSLNYAAFSGTSQSSPFVAGVAALIWSAEPALTAAEVRSRLRSTADDLGVTGVDSAFGSGRVNAFRALTATETAVPAPAPTPTPTPAPAPAPAPSACGTARSGTPTSTVYLPNITKTLGGADGWQTPFIVQNVGSTPTDLEVTFYRFDTGECVARLTRTALGAGTSQDYSPNAIAQLPHGTQFSVVARSFGAKVVSVVNEHNATLSPTRAEAMSYNGFSSGATSVFLPNVTRRFGGWVTPFIIQNLGTAATTVSARFVSFNGSAPERTVTRTIEPGRSKAVDPNSEPGLVDGTQYAVTITSAQPVAVVVNTHNDAPDAAEPVAMSANGIAGGAASVYGAYAAKNAAGSGRFSTIIVQNVGTTAVTPSLSFTRHTASGGAATPPQTFTRSAPLAPGASWAFDPRDHALADGEHSFVASAPGGLIAAAVNVHTQQTAMGYTAAPAAASTLFLPNVLRTFGGPAGWNTPVFLQAVTATGAAVEWRRFSDGALVVTQQLAIPAGSAVQIDPRAVQGLTDNTQYSVVVRGTGGTVTAIVMELASGGDNAMMYEGFAAP